MAKNHHRLADSPLPAEQNPFVTFVGQRTHSLINRIEAVDHLCSNEHVRRIRVGIKRWRTLYGLVTALLPHRVRSRKVEHAVQRLFKRAGNLRDCQLNRQLIAGLSLPATLEENVQHFLKKREKRAQRRLREAIKEVRPKRVRKVSRRIRQRILAVDPAQIDQQLSSFLDQNVHVIEALMQPDVSSEQLHTIRKHLKSVIEIGDIMHTITPDKSLARLMQRAKTGQRRLGDWHDRVSLNEQLNDYIVHHPNGLSPQKIRVLSDKLDKIT
ncbi:MAG: CHAD domain-containing protein, partial [Bacteroidetes bacterium]|nr:CHAD domain-containing protein [Fibrella sp.]